MFNKDFFAGLSSNFGSLYPDVKTLLNESKKFYYEIFATSLGYGPEEYENATLIGNLTIDEDEKDNILPSLTYEVSDKHKKNPPFYLITNSNNELIYAGTTFGVAGVSVSALTGGLLPPTENRDAYDIYLGLRYAIGFFGSLKVYQVNTGYSIPKIKNQYGDLMNLKKSDPFAQSILDFIMYSGKQPILTQLGSINANRLKAVSKSYKKDFDGAVDQTRRNLSIYNAVKSFKELLRNKGNVKITDGQLIVGKKTDDDTINISLSLAPHYVKIDFNGHDVCRSLYDEYKKRENDEIKRMVSNGAIELCQPERDNDKASEFSGKSENATYRKKVEVRQEKRKCLFESRLRELFGKRVVGLTYNNIADSLVIQHDPFIMPTRSFYGGSENIFMKIDFNDAYENSEVLQLVGMIIDEFEIDRNKVKVTYNLIP